MLERLAAGAIDGALAARTATISRVADELAHDAVPAWAPFGLWKSRLATPELVTLTHGQAAAGTRELSQLFRWVDDGLCFSRGVVGAGRIEEQLAGRVTATSNAWYAAVAVVPTSLHATGWAFHAATVVREAGQPELQVIDRLLAPETGTLPLSAWAAKVGRTAADVRIQSPLDNIPTGGGPLTVPALRPYLRAMGRDLTASIDAHR
jgi:hypothetical protein